MLMKRGWEVGGGGMFCHSVNEPPQHTKQLGRETSPVGRDTSSSVQ